MKYTITSGQMRQVIETPFHADAKSLVAMALQAMRQKPAIALGILMSVRGGQYVGDDEVYFSTERALADCGLMERAP